MSRRIVCWFSCGAASALATKMTLDAVLPGDEVAIVRCVVDNEHADNDRFSDDCAKWFGQDVISRRSGEYKDCWDVWERRRFMSGPRGAQCTILLKKQVRWDFEMEWRPSVHVFGFTADEKPRAARFVEQNPELRVSTPLIDAAVNKSGCLDAVMAAGIDLPVMYKLGFKNNNCIGCVKATSPAYWSLVREHFPDVFNRTAALSRDIGCRLTRIKGKRVFLDEIPADYDHKKRRQPEAPDCGVLCDGA